MPNRTRNGPSTGIAAIHGIAVRFGPTRSWMNADILRSASTEYATIVSTTPTSTVILIRLYSANCVVGSSAASIGLIFKKWSICKLNRHRHTRVAQPGPRQPVKRRNFLRHLVEQPLNAGKAVFAGHVVNQLVQKF